MSLNASYISPLLQGDKEGKKVQKDAYNQRKEQSQRMERERRRKEENNKLLPVSAD